MLEVNGYCEICKKNTGCEMIQHSVNSASFSYDCGCMSCHNAYGDKWYNDKRQLVINKCFVKGEQKGDD